MGISTLEDVQVSAEAENLKTIFFDETGYGPYDLISYSVSTRTFLTRNGGKYRIDDGHKIGWISGPSPNLYERELD